MPLGRYITLNILTPLEMKDSVAEDSMLGSGGLRCSLDDLSHLIVMLLNRGAYRGKAIVSEKMFDEIFRETVELPPSRFKEFRGIGWRIWMVDGRPYSMNHAALWDNTGGWIQVFPTLKAGYIFIANPPDFDREEFYGFYRKLKYRLLRLTGRLSDIDLDPTDFQVSALEPGTLQRLAGRYMNLQSGKVVDVSLSFSGNLVAYRPDTGERFDLAHSSGYTFIYVFPGQTEKGYAFDFIYRKGILKGLAIMDGYYTRL
jgi:hypothetical protein